MKLTYFSPVPWDSYEQRPHYFVRDFLRGHDDEAARYAALKRRVVERHPQDRLAYIKGKEDYVVGLEARAVAWARARA